MTLLRIINILIALSNFSDFCYSKRKLILSLNIVQYQLLRQRLRVQAIKHHYSD